MECMSGNDECPSGNFGDSLKQTNWMLDSAATFHMTPEVSDLIPGYDNGYPFISTLHNVLLAPNLCDKLFYIITLMNSGHACYLHKGCCTVYFIAKKKNALDVDLEIT